MTHKTMTLIQPDDWHLHIRSGLALQSVIKMSAAQVGRAIIMPNLNPPVVNTAQIKAYYAEIIKALPNHSDFQPLMTLYLTDNTSPKEIEKALTTGLIKAAKLYPAGATTHSKNGVTHITKIYPVLETMQKLALPLLIHGEVTDPRVDIFDREAVFIDQVLTQLTRDFPDLKIVFEHITTKQAVDFVLSSNDKLAATITPHHLLINRNDMLVGGIKPHYFCLPVLKRQDPHQNALLSAVTSGNAKFFIGTDSAPHAIGDKESSCGCAGIFTAHCAIELYAGVFEAQNALENFEGFVSKFGADFYHLPYNTKTVTLKKQNWIVPKHYPFADSVIKPFMAGQTLHWKLISQD